MEYGFSTLSGCRKSAIGWRFSHESLSETVCAVQYAAIYGKKGNYDSSAWTADYNCYGVAAAFADSVNSMEHLHSRYRDIGFETEAVTDDKDIRFVIKTEQPVEGNQADFIYY